MLHGDLSTEQLGEEINRVKEYKPPLAKVLDTFGPALMAKSELKAELLCSSAPEYTPDMERLAAGVPALSELDAAAWFPGMSEGFRTMLDSLKEAFPSLSREITAIQDWTAENTDAPEEWFNSILRGDYGNIRETAESLGIEKDAARFIVEQGLKPFFEAAAALMAPHVEIMRWDKGYCPVCGAYPDSTYLKKGKEEYEYLVAHGGQRWLHCSLCSREWRLRRMTCPYCDNEDADSLEYFQAEDRPHERIYACDKCKRYVTCIDVSELVDAPPGELLPFELLHMDIIAQRKGYKPMAWNLWNALEG